MIDTSLHIGQLTIYSPVTSITDYLISALTFYFYMRLRRKSNEQEPIINWSRFFLFMSLSTFMGGTAHGFFIFGVGNGFFVSWYIMQILNGISIYFMQKATLSTILKNSVHKEKWRIAYIIQLAIFIPSVIFFSNYLVTVIVNAVGFIPVMILHYRNKENKSSVMIGHSIAISFITAFVHLSKISVNDYFNNKDIAHIFINISFIVMFRGIKEEATSSRKLSVLYLSR